MNILEMRAREVHTSAMEIVRHYERPAVAEETIMTAIIRTLSAGNWDGEMNIANQVAKEITNHPDDDPLFTAIVYGLSVQNEAFRTMLLIKLNKHARSYELREDDDPVTARELLLSHSQS